MPQVLGHLEKEAEMATAALVGLIHSLYLYIKAQSAMPGYIRADTSNHYRDPLIGSATL